MAQKIRVTYSCDIPWGEHEGPAEPARFGLDGTYYEADLCEAHRQDLAEMTAQFRLFGRPVQPPDPRQPKRPAAKRRASRAARAWAVEHAAELGFTVKPKGQIPKAALEAYARRNQGQRA